MDGDPGPIKTEPVVKEPDFGLGIFLMFCAIPFGFIGAALFGPIGGGILAFVMLMIGVFDLASKVDR